MATTNQRSGLNTEQRQKQRLAHITQMKLGPYLEMANPEVLDRVKNELDENPALEKKNTDDEPLPQDQSADQPQDGDSTYDPEDEHGADDMKIRVRNVNSDDEYVTPTAVDESTLQDYLMDQLHESDLTEKQDLIAQYVVGSLDSNGYLHASLQSIADDITFNGGVETSAEEVKGIVDRLRTLDPPGVGAASLQDCILIQLKQMPKSDAQNVAIKVVEQQWDNFADKRYDRVVDALGITREQLLVANELIQKTNPKPGSGYNSGRSEIVTSQIIPDFKVEKDENGNLTVTLLNNIPELRISQSYEDAMRTLSAAKRNRAQSDNGKVIRDYVKRGQEFIELLRLRQQKLFVTMSAIVKHQRDFFLTGDPNEMRPLILKDIEEETGLDASTISRATRGKYVQTDFGTYSLKYFFNEGIGGVSQTEVKNALRKAVDGEDKKHPLSDDALCKALQQQGYEIKRRTVAKYREELDIPKASQRRTI